MPRASKAKSNDARVSKRLSCYLSPHERLLAHATLHCFPVVSFKLTITEAAPVVKEKNRMKMPKKTYFDNALNIFYNFRTNDGQGKIS